MDERGDGCVIGCPDDFAKRIIGIGAIKSS
jgi:hypothetical protein